ncbi:uncharacterized protein CANTADRAFT_26765 [Suhomyces tanzawaensis NRRL Y-17324]|uniref:CCA tRNA nucleotidyltransferase, mitochondrial n=1 Tax=Suhomyces tanzawaensis NRRL Y-17324 TaxID=984487 RepID=A0A1E4SH54_9ASCO|nr:uncharacterized protein CANTADRAFT_26765 [Suhomyces tanzawaensis NRRL Y-17324]ODV78838.1 hypothetical protein CANTADRAFT_26765 [Suhomyces tanzawaensis NRRL Y-17324]
MFSKVFKSFTPTITHSRSHLHTVPLKCFTHPTMKRPVLDKIELNETETNITNLLVEFCSHYNQSHTPEEALVLRITGGWVRDKLLGIESNDIDIAINHLSGEVFASKLYEYLEQKDKSLQLKAIHTIKKNPEKSKHLETCTTKIYGLDIDFVNLRSEEYTSESRVPIMKYGTAEEDALRRDATLNALFYNLNERKIEDFTGSGMNDLKQGILKTPLQPMQTFLDDPLRALRLIRFASRLDYEIEDNTLMAMKSPELKSTLVHKISRERVGIEMEKTFTSANPGYGLRLINYVGLSDSIFNFGTLTETITELNDQSTLSALEHANGQLVRQINAATYSFPLFQHVFQRIPKDSQLSSVYSTIFSNVEFVKAFWIAAVLLPYKDMTVKTNAKKNVLTHVPEVLLREGLKSSKSEIDKVSVLTKYRDSTTDVLSRFFEDRSSVPRSELGLLLRNFGSFLPLGILHNCFIDIVQPILQLNLPVSKPQPTFEYEPEQLESLETNINNQLQKYETFLNAVDDLGLKDVYLMKPIVDGKTLSKELGIRPGPWMGQVNNALLVWQLDNPEKGKKDALVYAREILPQYT